MLAVNDSNIFLDKNENNASLCLSILRLHDLTVSYKNK